MATSSRPKPRLLVGCVGDRFMPGVQASIAEAANRFTSTGAVLVGIQPSICILHLFGIVTMRNRICMKAAEEGFSHVLLLDNDVRLDDPDIFARLIEAGKDIIVPYFDRKFSKQILLGEPCTKRDDGIREIRWTCLSAIMFRTAVFAKIHPWPFFDTLCYCEEATTFQRWRLLGAPAFQHTSAAVALLRPPTNMWELGAAELLRIQAPGDVPHETIQSSGSRPQKPPPGREQIVQRGGGPIRD